MMLNVIMLSVIRLNVVMLCVVAPSQPLPSPQPALLTQNGGEGGYNGIVDAERENERERERDRE
jgi:hypothetical protein